MSYDSASMKKLDELTWALGRLGIEVENFGYDAVDKDYRESDWARLNNAIARMNGVTTLLHSIRTEPFQPFQKD